MTGILFLNKNHAFLAWFSLSDTVVIIFFKHFFSFFPVRHKFSQESIKFAAVVIMYEMHELMEYYLVNALSIGFYKLDIEAYPVLLVVAASPSALHISYINFRTFNFIV